jgi:hypothetical protein
LLVVLACGGSEMDGVESGAEGASQRGGSTVIEDLAADLREMAKARIYFGHHSVGANMLDGLRLLAAEQGVEDIQVVKLDEESAASEAFFAHSAVGRNGDPKSKVNEFAEVMREGLPAEPDVAFMKFCYVDFTPQTDVDELFAYYRSTMSRLSEERPRVRLLHTTVPLMERRRRVKDRVRLLLGMGVWEDDANIKRYEFNSLLRGTYDARLIIDIAREESTKPDGTRQQFRKDGQTYYSMNPAYTTDGGHLNEAGKRRVAAEMVRVSAREVRAGR